MHCTDQMEAPGTEIAHNVKQKQSYVSSLLPWKPASIPEQGRLWSKISLLKGSQGTHRPLVMDKSPSR